MTLISSRAVQHVWDYFDYTQDATWYQQVGYPLLKGVVQYWLATLVEDEYFKDGTLVSNPCSSPEHGNVVSFHLPWILCSRFSHLVVPGFDAPTRSASNSADYSLPDIRMFTVPAIDLGDVRPYSSWLERIWRQGPEVPCCCEKCL